jgi:hypothetical protein
MDTDNKTGWDLFNAPCHDVAVRSINLRNVKFELKYKLCLSWRIGMFEQFPFRINSEIMNRIDVGRILRSWDQPVTRPLLTLDNINKQYFL